VTAHDALLVFAAFLASAVEMVEALTIVLAVGVTRGWRTAVTGTLTAFVALAAIVAVFGPALKYIPIDALRLTVGALLLVFGLQWLRKAILRASGFKALHDEDEIFEREVADMQAHATDWYGFVLSFKGVFLEGMEVVFIVITFGGGEKGHYPLAISGAAAAFFLVALIGAAVHRPLSRVPENTMKFAVGAMLTTFGIFWGSEGAGIRWPAGDAALLGVLAFVLVTAWILVGVLRQRRARVQVAA
jgi:uncharacterized membrane protein